MTPGTDADRAPLGAVEAMGGVAGVEAVAAAALVACRTVESALVRVSRDPAACETAARLARRARAQLPKVSELATAVLRGEADAHTRRDVVSGAGPYLARRALFAAALRDPLSRSLLAAPQRRLRLGAHWALIARSGGPGTGRPLVHGVADGLLARFGRLTGEVAPTRALYLPGVGILLGEEACRELDRDAPSVCVVHELLHHRQPPAAARSSDAAHRHVEAALQEGVTELLATRLAGRSDPGISDRYARWRDGVAALLIASADPGGALWALCDAPAGERCLTLGRLLDLPGGTAAARAAAARALQEQDVFSDDESTGMQ